MKLFTIISAFVVVAAGVVYNMVDTKKSEIADIEKKMIEPSTEENVEENITEEIVQVPESSTTTNREELNDIAPSLGESATASSQLDELAEATAKISKAKVVKTKTAKKKSTVVIKKTKKIVKATKPATDKKVSDEVNVKQAATISVADIKDQIDPKTRAKFSGSISLGASTDNKATSDETKVYGSSMTIGLGYKINDTFSSSLTFSGSKDLSSSYEEKIGDTSLTLSHKAIKLAEKVSLSPSVTGVYPTSKTSKRLNDMYGAVSVGSSVVYAANPAVSFIYAPSVKSNFYKYETNRVGSSLTQYQAVNAFVIAYAINDKLSFSPSFAYINSWLHSGKQKDPVYSTTFKLGYAVAKGVSTSVGASTGGAHFGTEQGPDSDIKVFDENATSYFGNLSLAF